MKNWIFVGDLHTYQWGNFSSADGYINLIYDLIANKVRLLDEKIQKDSPGKTTVVFLGDLADEPYKRGRISIAVQNALLLAITALKNATECDVALIAGNHDMAAGGATWLNAFGRDGAGCADFIATNSPVMLPSTHTIAGGRVALVPYAAPALIEEWLANLPIADQRVGTVCGHFAFSGTKFENGCYDDGTGACMSRLSECSANWHYVLGHNHTPGMYGTGRENGIIMYPGLPVPYNFGYQHEGRLLFYSAFNFKSQPIEGPRFFGPVTHAGMDNLVLRKGDFVKVYVDAHDKHTIEALTRRYPGVTIFPCYEEVQNVETAGQTRCKEAAQLAGTGSAGLSAALTSYIKLQQARSNCAFTEEELMAEFETIMEGK
jgi:hypothetical protein